MFSTKKVDYRHKWNLLASIFHFEAFANVANASKNKKVLVLFL